MESLESGQYSWPEVECTHLTYSPDSTIAAACVPVSSASLLAICVSEYVQESGVEWSVYCDICYAR